MSTNENLPIAVFISGGGTTLRNLIAEQQAGRLPVDFRLVISSNPNAKGLQFASEAHIPSLVVEKHKGLTSAQFSEALFAPCRQAGVALVVMAGFLKHALIPADFAGKVMNIHPSLIPNFSGKGMYGHFVHEAVIAAKAKTSGCTVHFVDNLYDHGPVILQREVPVLETDTPDTLAARVFQAECEALPSAIRWYRNEIGNGVNFNRS